ncbi:hypothetical protein GJ496_000084 [Pomphorhynchus laevis]|nr:hypothetical protein GJ496_000084 [Pomphorhynchus laevis]
MTANVEHKRKLGEDIRDDLQKMEARLEARIYAGNLPKGIRQSDVEDIFIKYGKINYLDIKDGQSGSYAFIEFDSVRDAEDAVVGRDGYDFDGYRLRVEFCRGGRGRFNDDYRSGGGFGGRYRGSAGPNRGYPRRRPGPPSRRTDYRLLVSNLPPSGSWQDLKDHMREAGDVCYADVYRDGTGVVEFVRHDGLKYAVKHLDESKFRSHEGETSYIRVRIDPACRSYSYSRSRSRSISSSRRYERRTSRRRHSYSSPSRGGSRSRRASEEYDRSPRDSRDRHSSPSAFKSASSTNHSLRRSYRSSRSRSPVSSPALPRRSADLSR